MNLSEAYLNRFAGLARLYGNDGLSSLFHSHVAVIGIGGVGSWVAEALARSGVGEITLIDFDDVCTSNFNRQILATNNSVGKMKVDVMGERILQINSECRLHLINEKFSQETATQLLSPQFDYIVDAFDNGPGKAFLASHCRKNKKKLIVIGSVGGKKDPTKIKIDDLSRSAEDSLLSFVRKKLRGEYGFPREKNKKFLIPCVYSTEKYTYPDAHCNASPLESSILKNLDCGGGMGAVTHLAGATAFFAVSRVITDITKGET